jgi:hypothetical protein
MTNTTSLFGKRLQGSSKGTKLQGCWKYFVAAFLVVFARTTPSEALDVIINGDFETGTFSSWIAETTQANPFPAALNDGNNSEVINNGLGVATWFLRNQPANYFVDPANPISNFGAFNGFDGSPGTFSLRQGFSFTDPLLSADLNFEYGVQSSYFGDPRVFTANILDQSGATQLANVFTFTQPTGSQTPWNPTNINFDIASTLNTLGSGNYQLQFSIYIPQDFTGPAQFGIDNISLDIAAATYVVPEPSAWVLLALGLLSLGMIGRRCRVR